jgi:DNA-directed RNA polymerase specialized sigma24 family protein
MKTRFRELNGGVFAHRRQPSAPRATEFRPRRSASIRSRYVAWLPGHSLHSRLRSEVREARRCLSPRENRVIELLYDLGWQSREVAAEPCVNESRVSQIKLRAISKLRLQLEPDNARRTA